MTGVPRAVSCSYSDKVLHSRAVQRHVYRKLVLQTGLQVLRLDFAHGSLNFPGLMKPPLLKTGYLLYQTQCLETSLASGLHELAGLKKLIKLDVSHMAHAISVPELEWMALNWPKLSKIIGLFKNCRNPVPGAREWIMKISQGGPWLTVETAS
ncbi:MAG: hypothetical protein BYD32DRAFT_434625 [Podila humilis]|nr:MAG: hypothetical protein BYD32DRAFT_434625 [Podila humilis]